MQTTQKQETSTDSPYEESEFAQPFEVEDFPHFHVEYTEKGSDIVYHFWPPGENGSFPVGFLTHVQEGFRKCLPSDYHGRVEADFTSLQEAQVHHMHNMGAVPRKDMNKEIVIPRETVYVRVPEAMKLPLADVFLKGRVFRTIEDEFRGEG